MPLLALWLSLAASAGGAFPDVRVTAPEGGGLAALEVAVDTKSAVVLAGAMRIPIGLGKAELPDDGAVVLRDVTVRGGKHIVHVRVPVRGAGDADPRGPAWEAVLAAGRAPLFAGRTGFATGDPGERIGKAIEMRAGVLLLGDIREDLGICGQPLTLLSPKALYPESLSFRSATVQRLSEERAATAEQLVAVETGALGIPLAKLLVARGSSVADTQGEELTDGDSNTAWRERRPGIGQGEFVALAAPRDVPIARIQMVFSPPHPEAGFAVPKSFYVATEARVFEVAVPEAAATRPGAAFEIAFPRPIEASCVSLVLGDAYAKASAHPNVGIAELVAFSEFDAPGAALGDVAHQLGGARAKAAAEVLERANGSQSAVMEAFDGLNARGRALAVDVAGGGPRCEAAAPLLARALCSKAGDAPRRAQAQLERCPKAAPVLAAYVRDEAALRACVAPTLALLAPADALAAIASGLDATPTSDGETRAALRSALGEAVATVGAGLLAPILTGSSLSLRPDARLDVLRAAGPRVAEVPAAGEAAVAYVLGDAAPLRARYLVLEPLAFLAGAGDAEAARRLALAITADRDWPVRARAAELAADAAGSTALIASLLSATRDPEPRVREAAFATLAVAGAARAEGAALDSLAGERWPFVEVQAVSVLMNGPVSARVDAALAEQLRSGSARVRAAAAASLGKRRAVSYAGALRSRLDDATEENEVRAAAASALGTACNVESTDALTALVRPLASGVAGEDERELGLGALAGLSALHPSDLASRLSPLMAPSAPPATRAAAQRALASKRHCP